VLLARKEQDSGGMFLASEIIPLDAASPRGGPIWRISSSWQVSDRYAVRRRTVSKRKEKLTTFPAEVKSVFLVRGNILKLERDHFYA
jgi:hypothetical protein